MSKKAHFCSANELQGNVKSFNMLPGGQRTDLVGMDCEAAIAVELLFYRWTNFINILIKRAETSVLDYNLIDWFETSFLKLHCLRQMYEVTLKIFKRQDKSNSSKKSQKVALQAQTGYMKNSR